MESGKYRGFISVAMDLFKEKMAELHQEKPIYSWRVYTDRDFSLTTPPKQPSEYNFDNDFLL
jgi:hypothetical protein